VLGDFRTSTKSVKLLIGSNCIYSFKRPEIHLVVNLLHIRYGEFLKMINTNRILVHPLFSEYNQDTYSAIHAPRLSRGILTIALAVVVCAAAPIKMAEAQSASIELGYPTDLKAADTKKKTIKSRNTISTKIVKASYFGRAPYICTPSGFGRTSMCFAR
jgi:hypothetical protein